MFRFERASSFSSRAPFSGDTLVVIERNTDGASIRGFSHHFDECEVAVSGEAPYRVLRFERRVRL